MRGRRRRPWLAFARVVKVVSAELAIDEIWLAPVCAVALAEIFISKKHRHRIAALRRDNNQSMSNIYGVGARVAAARRRYDGERAACCCGNVKKQAEKEQASARRRYHRRHQPSAAVAARHADRRETLLPEVVIAWAGGNGAARYARSPRLIVRRADDYRHGLLQAPREGALGAQASPKAA